MVQGRKVFRTRHWLMGGLLLLGTFLTLLVTAPVHAVVKGTNTFSPIAQTLPLPVKNTVQIQADAPISEWMPDVNLQKIVLYNYQQDVDKNMTLDQLTQADMAKMTRVVSADYQNVNKANWQSLLAIKSLEGLQYGTNLTEISLQSDTNANLNWGNTLYAFGNISDISPLKELTKLKSIDFAEQKITDVSPLANLTNLTHVGLGYNRISDISPLAFMANIPPTTVSTLGTGFQSIQRPAITVNPAVTKIVTPAYNIKDLKNANATIQPFKSSDTSIPDNIQTTFMRYQATADGTNVNPTTIQWTNLSKNGIGYLTAYWHALTYTRQDNYDGVVITPYILDDTIGNLFVNYETADGTPLHDPTILAEKLGTDYDLTTNTTVKGIVDGIKAQGYDVKVTGNEKGTYTKEGTTVTYTFTKAPAKVEVPVHYLDADKKAIAGQTDGKLSGVPTDKLSATDWTTAQRKIDGYTYSHAEVDGKTVDPTTLTYADLSTGLNMIYTKNAPEEKNGTVIAKYVDENGHDLSKAVTQTGKVGDPYATAQLAIDGYTFKQMAAGSAPVKGQYIDGTLTVTYVYAPNTPVEQYGTVITRFVDSTGTVIRDQVSTTGKVGTSYTTSPVTVSGYTYLRVASGSAQPSGQYIHGTLTVTYVYQKNTPPVTQYGTVIAQYVDDQGNTIRTAITTSGLVGTNYTTGQLTIPGYTFKQIASGSAATSGLYVNGTLTVTYVYTKDTAPIPETSKVIARYVDENGTAIHDEIVTTGKVGDPYSTDQLLIKGYTYQQLAAGSAPIYGVYTKDTQIVTYVYSKIDTGGETPGTGDDGDKTPGTGGESGDKQPTTPTKPGQGGGTTGGTTSPVETPTGNSEAARKGQLPQTDEDEGLTSMLLTILGVALLGVAAVSYRKLRD
ncbi:MAG: MucBP domain-containing protein [Schleiferilactobacillus harbinensis]|jgi:hypothetical protein|nr:MucBP domain-containing protein [Schleiferilactobacillus harbinensis]MCI1913058.1 MucBP domain-containing protein [Schleiferilactobacillus harbinensis]